MKKKSTHDASRLLHNLCLLLLACILLPAAAWSQSIQSVNPTSTTAGQNITMIVTGSNTNFQTVTGIFLRNGGTVYQGSNINISSTTNLTVDFAIPPNATLGNYSLNTYGQFATYPNALNVGVGPGSAYGLVSGKVILDNNANCTEDTGDNAVSGRIVTLTPGPIYLTTGANGDFSGWVPNGTYTASVANFPCGSWVCPSGGTHAVSVTTPLSQDTGNDFYWQPVVCADLRTSIYLPILRPGFDAYIHVDFRNSGMSSVSNVVATVDMPTGLTVLNVSPTPSSIVGNTYTWNFPSMAVGVNNTATFFINIPVAAGLGTPFTVSSSIPPVGSDPNLNNNTATATRNTQGAYDPNDKQAWDEFGQIAGATTDPTTTRLDYLIRFQNTGTDTAFNIFIRDTLDPLVDPGSLVINGASHNYQYTLTGDRNVQFTFPNILLVDSFANEPLSHGWIAYSVNLDAGLPIGTTIENTAHIYFDFNAPVATNTTQSTLCKNLASTFSFTNTGWAYDFTDLSDASATSWSWDFGDGGTSTLQNPSHTYSAPGNYTVCLIATSACTSDTVCQSLLIVGVDATPSIASLRVAPNPSSGRFDLLMRTVEEGELRLRVMDMQGRVVWSHAAQVTVGDLREHLDLAGYASGLYLLELQLNDQVETLRLHKN